MKKIILIFSVLFSFSVVAQAIQKNTILEVSFEKNRKSHQYFLTKSFGKNSAFVISFKNEKRKIQSRKLSQRQAELIKNEATRIIWENQYRNPASLKSCHEYVSIKTDSEKTKVCYENKALTGESFGFLNSLNNIFH